MLQGLKFCTICDEIIETKNVFKHNKKHPKKRVVLYGSIYENDILRTHTIKKMEKKKLI